jgi:carbon monoxide dehydrogenase subunit G
LKVERDIRIAAPRAKVWELLWDVPRLAACIPGATDVRAIEDGKRYAAVVADKVGPFRVKFPLQIDVLEAQAPDRLRARAGGRDTAVDGMVKVDLDVALSDVEGATGFRLVADISVLGKLGTLGHSVIVRRGNDIVDRFADNIRRVLESEPPPRPE